jgi:hypothetical protein
VCFVPLVDFLLGTASRFCAKYRLHVVCSVPLVDFVLGTASRFCAQYR